MRRPLFGDRSGGRGLFHRGLCRAGDLSPRSGGTLLCRAPLCGQASHPLAPSAVGTSPRRRTSLRSPGSPEKTPQVDGSVGTEAHPFALEQRALGAPRRDGAPRGADHPVAGDVGGGSSQQPSDQPRMVGPSEQPGQLAVCGDAARGNLSDKLVELGVECRGQRRVLRAGHQSSLSLSRSAFSATIRWSMTSWMSPSMKAARL